MSHSEVIDAAKAYVAFGHPREGSLKYHAAYERLEKALASLEIQVIPAESIQIIENKPLVHREPERGRDYIILCKEEDCEATDLIPFEGAWYCERHLPVTSGEAIELRKLGWRFHAHERQWWCNGIWYKYSWPYWLHHFKRAFEIQWSDVWDADLKYVRSKISHEESNA